MKLSDIVFAVGFWIVTPVAIAMWCFGVWKAAQLWVECWLADDALGVVFSAVLLAVLFGAPVFSLATVLRASGL